MRVAFTRQFKRDLRRLERQGPDLELLWELIDLLRNDQLLPERCRAHRLSGRLAGLWECHIKGDWVMTWELQEDEILMARCGSHTEILGL